MRCHLLARTLGAIRQAALRIGQYLLSAVFRKKVKFSKLFFTFFSILGYCMQTKEEILKEAIGTGEVIKIKYNGGSQPGAIREITVKRISNGKLHAYCITSKTVKSFDIDKTEIVSDDLSVSYESEAQNPTDFQHIIDICKKEKWENLGWKIESADDFIALYKKMKNGTYPKYPYIIISYANNSGKPWRVTCKGKTTITYVHKDKALAGFLKYFRDIISKDFSEEPHELVEYYSKISDSKFKFRTNTSDAREEFRLYILAESKIRQKDDAAFNWDPYSEELYAAWLLEDFSGVEQQNGIPHNIANFKFQDKVGLIRKLISVDIDFITWYSIHSGVAETFKETITSSFTKFYEREGTYTVEIRFPNEILKERDTHIDLVEEPKKSSWLIWVVAAMLFFAIMCCLAL